MEGRAFERFSAAFAARLTRLKRQPPRAADRFPPPLGALGRVSAPTFTEHAVTHSRASNVTAKAVLLYAAGRRRPTISRTRPSTRFEYHRDPNEYYRSSLHRSICGEPQ